MRSVSGNLIRKTAEKAEEMKECLEDFALAQKKSAYIQDYVDYIQALYHMGLLKENEGLKMGGEDGCTLRDVSENV